MIVAFHIDSSKPHHKFQSALAVFACLSHPQGAAIGVFAASRNAKGVLKPILSAYIYILHV